MLPCMGYSSALNLLGTDEYMPLRMATCDCCRALAPQPDSQIEVSGTQSFPVQSFSKQGQEGPVPPALGIVSNTSQAAQCYLGRGLGPGDCRGSSGIGSSGDRTGLSTSCPTLATTLALSYSLRAHRVGWGGVWWAFSRLMKPERQGWAGTVPGQLGEMRHDPEPPWLRTEQVTEVNGAPPHILFSEGGVPARAVFLDFIQDSTPTPRPVSKGPHRRMEMSKATPMLEFTKSFSRLG